MDEHEVNENTIKSLERSKELKEAIHDYVLVKNQVKTGFNSADQIRSNREIIMKELNASEEQWNDWQWQYKNRIRDVEILKRLNFITEKRANEIEQVEKKQEWVITPYYLSLFDTTKLDCPIKMQVLPSIKELNKEGQWDPVDERNTSPVPGITRRYPDRLIINVTNKCGSFCRHCQRRRNISCDEKIMSKENMEVCFDYIRNNPEIRDVLVTGGDALCLSDNLLDWILKKLYDIPNVETVRLGTRVLVTLPQRITDNLCSILEKYSPIYINTQFNSPVEVTKEVQEKCKKLLKAGVILGNQTVLLNGINNDKYVLLRLNQLLLQVGIRPYYLFHPMTVIGTKHFYVPIEEGIKIYNSFIGRTSGLARPMYILNLPGGKGKVPLNNDYILGHENNCYQLKNWEGDIINYPENF